MAHSFKNLAIKGGGIRGIAYLGALEVLEQEKIIENLENVSGASAGAITALVTAMYPKDFQKIRDVANSLDFKKVPQTPKKRGLFSLLSPNLREGVNLVEKHGLHSTKYIHNWFRQILADRFDGNSDITFKEFNASEDCLNLSIAVTNISSTQSIVCNEITTPDQKVADIVRTSMDIPIFFESDKYNVPSMRGYFGDGGVMYNYPITLWDKSDTECNEDTIGLFLYTKEERQNLPKKYKIKEFAGDLIFSLLLAQDWAMSRQPEDLKRSIQIDDVGVKATDFDVAVDDPVYKRLYASGKTAAKEYFKNLKSDPDKLKVSKFTSINAKARDSAFKPLKES